MSEKSITDMNADEAAKAVGKAGTFDELVAFRAAELGGKGRKSVLDAIAARRRAIDSEIPVDESRGWAGKQLYGCPDPECSFESFDRDETVAHIRQTKHGREVPQQPAAEPADDGREAPQPAAAEPADDN